jgi:hypothetical protein
VNFLFCQIWNIILGFCHPQSFVIFCSKELNINHGELRQ